MSRTTGPLLSGRFHEEALTNLYAIAFELVPLSDLVRRCVELVGDQRKCIAALHRIVQRLPDECGYRLSQMLLARCFLALGGVDRVDVIGKGIEGGLLAATGCEFS